MAKIRDLIGQKFGRLTVISRVIPAKRVRWACKCECGNTTEVYSINLLSGDCKSCGCLKPVLKLSSEEVAFRLHLRDYKRNADRRGYDFDLTDEEFRDMTKQECHYCGSEKGIGVDRMDNSIGYTIGNSVPCCNICNRAKHTMSYLKYTNWISKIKSNGS